MKSVYLRLLLIAGAVLVADQLSKSWALSSLDEPRTVIDGILAFRLTYNSGGAFGLLQGYPEVFLVATIVATVAILFWVRNLEQRSWAVPLGLVLGGGLGNVTDRVMRDTDGRVVDFIDLKWWPVFNVADMCIVSGVVLILFLGFKDPEKEERAVD
jgi:signal peptidase II